MDKAIWAKSERKNRENKIERDSHRFNWKYSRIYSKITITMKILLTAINAKYIHSNLAVYSLKAYAQSVLRTEKSLEENAPEDMAPEDMAPEDMEQEDDAQDIQDIRDIQDIQIEIAEYTINQQLDDILRDIYKREPDMLCLSCYIWNIQYVEEIVREMKKIAPTLSIWLGGPEVSYDGVAVLQRLPEVEGVMKGEGEETFAQIASSRGSKDILYNLAGITWRDKTGAIIENPWRPIMDLSRVPFVYQDMADFEHKIIYYESSRGCPFSCSYCLSSIDKKLRFRDIELVKKELQFFIDHEVPQVKFVDRTFNCKHDHAMTIWKYLIDHDRGITNFHFEVSADLLNEEEITLIQSMRPGLIQLEIGVQSTNEETIREIRRTMRFPEVARIVGQIQKNANVHQHLDLIAGLPYEGIDSFARSFDEVYALHPEQLQLGFLKVLKGSYMEEMQEQYGLVYKSTPPYEVLYTKWLSYAEVLRLKGIEDMVEVYYNSGQFRHTIKALEQRYDSAFEMYDRMAAYYEVHQLNQINHSRVSRYDILLAFLTEEIEGQTAHSEQQVAYYREWMTYDYYLRENAKNRPEFAGEYCMDKEEVRRFYEAECDTPPEERRYLLGYEAYDRNQMRKMTHLERFAQMGRTVLFDYASRDPLTREARTVILENDV